MCKGCIRTFKKFIPDGKGRILEFNFFDIQSRKDYLNIFVDNPEYNDIKEKLQNLEKIEERYNQLLCVFNQYKTYHNYYGLLTDWELTLHESKWALGMAHYTEKVISISIHSLLHDKYELNLETLRHELAHIFTQGHGHDEIWQKWAIFFGAKPRACCNNSLVGSRKEWILMCENLCFQDYQDHKNKDYIEKMNIRCTMCHGKLNYLNNPHFKSV
jgi:predicted SprT family Zn-dependent metalloprotease